ncbi:MAG TPA: hypothetical protein VLF90_03720 [Patescibacteria group bacterium]|nr:hypothetical protein [Patescibacteria group bacterium]
MRSNRFIATPIRSEKHVNYMEDVFDDAHNWQKRARKLRDRRWRKLASRMAISESHSLNGRHLSY